MKPKYTIQETMTTAEHTEFISKLIENFAELSSSATFYTITFYVYLPTVSSCENLTCICNLTRTNKEYYTLRVLLFSPYIHLIIDFPFYEHSAPSRTQGNTRKKERKTLRAKSLSQARADYTCARARAAQ